MCCLLHTVLLSLIATSLAFVAPSFHTSLILRSSESTAADPFNPPVPPPLTLEEIASKVKFEVTDLDSGRYGLESKDAAYAISIHKFTLPLKPSLGIALEEVRRGRDGRGLVLVGGIQPGAHAEGKVERGDVVAYLGKDPDGMSRVEGSDLTETMAALRDHIQTSSSDQITLLIKRLVLRKTIKVTFQYEGDKERGEEGWKQDLPMLTGSNLRKEMLRQGLPVYDAATSRFDQPYVQGDCGGEGLCCTCIVQTLEGNNLLNEPDELEQMAMRK